MKLFKLYSNLAVSLCECLRQRKTYGQRLEAAAEKLGKSKRTVQRLVKKWEEEGLEAIAPTNRSDKGSFRIEEKLQEFIITTYKNGNKGSRRVTRKQVKATPDVISQ